MCGATGAGARVTHRPASDTEYDVVLGCRDNHVRVYITGTAASMEMSVDGPVMALCRYGSKLTASEAMTRGGFKELVYATRNGRVGQILVRATQPRTAARAADHCPLPSLVRRTPAQSARVGSARVRARSARHRSTACTRRTSRVTMCAKSL